jgi:hypothetical protein
MLYDTLVILVAFRASPFAQQTNPSSNKLLAQLSRLLWVFRILSCWLYLLWRHLGAVKIHVNPSAAARENNAFSVRHQVPYHFSYLQKTGVGCCALPMTSSRRSYRGRANRPQWLFETGPATSFRNNSRMHVTIRTLYYASCGIENNTPANCSKLVWFVASLRPNFIIISYLPQSSHGRFMSSHCYHSTMSSQSLFPNRTGNIINANPVAIAK